MPMQTQPETPRLTLVGVRDHALDRHFAGASRLRDARLGRKSSQEREERRQEAQREAGRAARERAIRKQVAAEWRASLTPAQRRAQAVGRILLALRVLTIALAVVAPAAAALHRAPIELAPAGALYVVLLVLASRRAGRRAAQLPDDRADLVREQLERLRSSLPPS
jgi:Flp pilus assembly protein TadB